MTKNKNSQDIELADLLNIATQKELVNFILQHTYYDKWFEDKAYVEFAKKVKSDKKT